MAGSEEAEAGPRHITLLVCDGRGWSNLCRIITLAHAHTREGANRRELGDSSLDLQVVLDHAEGLICLTGCAERSAIGAGVGDELTAGGCGMRSGRRACSSSCSAPTPATTRARNNALAALGRRLGIRCVATGDVHAHARVRAELAGCVRGAAKSRHAPTLQSRCAGETTAT